MPGTCRVLVVTRNGRSLVGGGAAVRHLMWCVGPAQPLFTSGCSAVWTRESTGEPVNSQEVQR